MSTAAAADLSKATLWLRAWGTTFFAIPQNGAVQQADVDCVPCSVNACNGYCQCHHIKVVRNSVVTFADGRQDMQCVENCEPDNPEPAKHYSQPVIQTLQMFVGEMSCLMLYGVIRLYRYLKKRHEQKMREREPLLTTPVPIGYGSANASMISQYAGVAYPYSNIFFDGGLFKLALGPRAKPRTSKFFPTMLKFLPAASCDICGTTLMNVALLIMPVSIFQMTRGALVMWVGLFSVLFLRHRLYFYQWLSLVLVMMGVASVGMSSVVGSSLSSSAFLLPVLGADSSNQTSNALFGLLLVLFAQIFSAVQFVWEEKVMGDDEVPAMLAVGLEGTCGALQVLVLMTLLHFAVGRTEAGRGGFFDMHAGWHQTVGTRRVLWSSIGCAISIAGFNLFGMSVTKRVSATARSTIDTLRTLGICFVSLVLGWEVLRPLSGTLQALGFVMLAYGTFLFNGVVDPPVCLQPVEHHVV